MAKFEVVSKYKDCGLAIPVRSTAHSAGYDFEVAEDIEVFPLNAINEMLSYQVFEALKEEHPLISENQLASHAHPYTLSEMSDLTKKNKLRPTLVPTGIKCQLADDEYLKLVVRSSCPLKHWLVLANGEGIIDADYYNNPDNEGEIFFQIINLSPISIQLKKGDKIGQGIIQKYIITEDDNATGERVGGLGSTS